MTVMGTLIFFTAIHGTANIHIYVANCTREKILVTSVKN